MQINSIKLIIFVFVVLIIVATISYLSLYIFPKPSEIFSVYIKGEVISLNKSLDLLKKNKELYLQKKPEILWIYKPYYNPNLLCRADIVKLVNIKWMNETYGTFETTLEIKKPTELILTVDCGSFVYTSIKVDRQNTEFNTSVIWDYKEDSGKTLIENNYRNEIKRVEDYISGLMGNSDIRDLNLLQVLDYYRDLDTAFDLLRQAKEEKVEETVYLKALHAHWFAERARHKAGLYVLESCINEYEQIKQNYSNDECYRIDNEIHQSYVNANSTLNQYIIISYWDIRNSDDIDRVKTEINVIYSDTDRIQIAQSQCRDALDSLKKSFEYQSEYCESRETRNTVLIISLIALIPLFGLIVGFYLEKKELISNIFRKISFKNKINFNEIYEKFRNKPVLLVILSVIILFIVNVIIYYKLPLFALIISLILTTITQIERGAQIRRYLKKGKQ